MHDDRPNARDGQRDPEHIASDILAHADAIRRAVDLLFEPGQIVELRAIGPLPSGRGNRVEGGYFDDHDRLAEVAAEIDKEGWAEGIYVGLNPVCGKVVTNHRKKMARATADKDIGSRRWFFVDIDFKRESKTSATDAEKQAAREVMGKIRSWATAHGWSDPVVADSANGFHLLFRIDLPNDGDSRILLRDVLKQLAAKFNDGGVHVDQVVFNAARIVKLYGTTPHKGEATPERPHRQAKLLEVPEQIDVLPIDKLQELVGERRTGSSGAADRRSDPSETTHPRGTETSTVEDAEAYLREQGHQISKVKKNTPTSGATLFELEKCPVNSDDDQQRKGFAIAYANGGVYLSCHRDRCRLLSRYVWLAESHPGSEIVPGGVDGRGRLFVELPGDSREISAFCRESGRAFAMRPDDARVFLHGDRPVSITRGQLKTIDAQMLRSQLEEVAATWGWKKLNHALVRSPMRLKSDIATAFVVAAAFRNELPVIKTFVNCPLLAEDGGELYLVVGYSESAQLYARGEPPPEVSLDDARRLILDDLLGDYLFLNDHDRSRGVAGIISPALIWSGLLGESRPAMVTLEANSSQAGKGFYVRLIDSIYNAGAVAISQRSGFSVGGIDEKFDSQLIAGRSLLYFDNIRTGRKQLDLQNLESFLTEPRYTARSAFEKNVTVETTRTIVMLTVNSAQLTRDLSKRSLIIRIRKQPGDYNFRCFDGTTLEEHIAKSRLIYLGSILAIVREWHRQGKKRTDARMDTFTAWAGSLDWIVQNLFGLPSLLEGHQAIQRRVSLGHLSWLRGAALVVQEARRNDEWLRTNELVRLIDARPDLGVEIPGLREDESLEDDRSFQKACRATGTMLGKCFAGSETHREGDLDVMTIEVEGVAVDRTEMQDLTQRRPSPQYRFRRQDDCAHAPTSCAHAVGADAVSAPPSGPESSETEPECAHEDEVCAHGAPTECAHKTPGCAQCAHEPLKGAQIGSEGLPDDDNTKNSQSIGARGRNGRSGRTEPSSDPENKVQEKTCEKRTEWCPGGHQYRDMVASEDPLRPGMTRYECPHCPWVSFRSGKQWQ